MKIRFVVIALVSILMAACTASKKTTTTAVTYLKDVKPIIDANCASKCHGAENPAAGINLTSYAVVREQSVNGKLIPAIQQVEGVVPMPKKNPKLDDASIQKIVDWVAAGAAE